MRKSGRSGSLTVLFYPSLDIEGRWIAHLLDFDLVGTGDTPKEAFEELLGTLEVEAQSREEDPGLVPPSRAPAIYWRLAEEKGLSIPTPEVKVELGRFAELYHRRRSTKCQPVNRWKARLFTQTVPEFACQ